jgi:acetylornithine deacetylase/succinyl-diaminopimelate desuccinylase-like protein
VSVQTIREYVRAERERFVAELVEFLRFPSISTEPECAGDVRACCDWLKGKIEELGLVVEIDESSTHPTILAKTPNMADETLPHLLLYGHYDVQPVDPVGLWKSPPFEPTIREGAVFARGASDNKGQIYAHLKAIETMLKSGSGELPVRVTLLVEGEEEIGSPSLDALVERRKDELSADVILVSDCDQHEKGRPAISYGLRGLSAVEFKLKGPNRDLHSGTYGGVVQNPIHALASILAGLRGPDGKILVPGMYDDVRDLKPWELEAYEKLGEPDEEWKRDLEVDAFFGEEGYSTYARTWARPTLEVNGVWGGYQGAGTKTVIPSEAGAKITCRLVPDQDPEKIVAAVEARIRELLPPGVTVEFQRHGNARALYVPKEGPAMEVAERAIRSAWNADPVYTRIGGSIPVTSYFLEKLGKPSLLVGFALPDDNHHSPNEKFDLEEYEKGIVFSCAFMRELAAVGSSV